MKFLILIIFLVSRHKFTRMQKESLKHFLQSSLKSHSMCIVLLISGLVSQGFCQLGNCAVISPKISVFEFFLNVKKAILKIIFWIIIKSCLKLLYALFST